MAYNSTKWQISWIQTTYLMLATYAIPFTLNSIHLATIKVKKKSDVHTQMCCE